MDTLVSQVIINILQQEMSVRSDRIWIRDQNRNIPGDNGLFIIVGMIDAHPPAQA